MKSAKANVSSAHLALRAAVRKIDGAGPGLAIRARAAILFAWAFSFLPAEHRRFERLEHRRLHRG